jgi:hypothetical protein
MNFTKAYKELMGGAKIRRKEWGDLMFLHYKDGTLITYKAEHTHFYHDVDILISKDWMVLGSDGKEIPFIEVIEELKNKKQVRRLTWKENEYLYIDNGQFVYCKPIECDFMPTFQCLCSSDWEILK